MMALMLRDGDGLRIGKWVGLWDTMAIWLCMVNMYDLVVGATCATVRSAHAHKIDRLRLMRVWHPFVWHRP